LAEPKIVSNPSNTAAYNHRERDQGPVSLRHQKQIKAIVDITPHLRPASNIISPLLQVSEVAQEAVRRNDPLKASLIAFGDIQSHSRNRPISVAAYATGSTGCDLCIVQVQKQKRGWFDDRSSWLEVPTLRGGQPTWSSRGGTIQQVHFASKSRPGPDLLAVRLLAGTTIIRAVQDKTPSEEASGFSISSTTLHNVEIRQTGGHTHVDVAFNPWFSQQVALVDIAGNWTVLEFSARNMLQVAHTWSGLARKTSDEKVSPITDGWARIAWVMSLGILAVCTRQCLNLFSIAGGDPTLVEEVELGLSGAVPWVLDFAVLPGHLDHFCVLTSTHVMVYKAVEKTSSKKIARIKFNTRHYKNPEDLSLRLAMWTEEGEEGTANKQPYDTSNALTLDRCRYLDIFKSARTRFLLSTHAFRNPPCHDCGTHGHSGSYDSRQRNTAVHHRKRRNPAGGDGTQAYGARFGPPFSRCTLLYRPHRTRRYGRVSNPVLYRSRRSNTVFCMGGEAGEFELQTETPTVFD
jgi:RNA polymerase I-specific transcription initiation factor RRN6